MVSDEPVSSGSDEKAQSDATLWWQKVLAPFLSVHFVITMVLLFFWLWALTGPLGALRELYPKLAADESSSKVATAAIEAVAKSAGAISALFTTVIGVVLGHYFGQRGVEAAEDAKARAEEVRAEVAEDFDVDGEALAETVEQLSVQLDIRDAAIAQAVELLEAQSVEIDEDSPLARVLSPEEEDEEGEEEEGGSEV